MPDYTEYTAVILALVELRAQVADDITHTHLSAALKRLHSLRDDALLRAAALPVGLKRRDGEPSLRQYRARPGPGTSREPLGALPVALPATRKLTFPN
jgi:hypothetical protein